MGYLSTFSFIVLDFFTGLLKAFATGAFSSSVMRRGLFHKMSLICVMALGWLVEYAQRFVELGIDFTIPAGGAACGYIILMEICSSLENLCEFNPELVPGRLYQVFGVKAPSDTNLVPPDKGGAPKAQEGANENQ